MIEKDKNKITLKNNISSVTVDLFGGAIVDFHLKTSTVNPLAFRFSKAQMPPNNRKGAPYQGHFLCLGRWGPPSVGECKAGMPDHGQMANILWQHDNGKDLFAARMHAIAPLEGLQVGRYIAVDETNAVYGVEEKVTNFFSLGRLYNMVQHPTIAAPFLDETTYVECNAEIGFDQFSDNLPNSNPFQWPIVRDENGNLFDIRTPGIAYNAVISFIVEKKAEYGWISAYSSRHRLLLGYIWRRTDYPWIHLWQHWNNSRISYRGIEFGTGGLHKPFNEIIETGIELFGVKAAAYIDAGETSRRCYLSFLYQSDDDIHKVHDIRMDNDEGYLTILYDTGQIELNTQFKNFL